MKTTPKINIILGFLLTACTGLVSAQNANAADTIGLDSRGGEIQVLSESVTNAVRGGTIGDRNPIFEQVSYIEMLCTDTNAETIEKCGQYSMAIVQPYPNDEAIAQVTIGKTVFSKSDLASYKNFKQALDQAKVNRSFGTFVNDLENPLAVTIGLAKLFSWGNEPALLIGAVLATPIAAALTPFAGVYGAVDALAVKHKFKRYMKSVVQNDKNANVLFGDGNYNNVEDKTP